MRIIGGSLSGRRIGSPSSGSIRPTAERNRQSLFDVLEHGGLAGFSGLSGKRVADLFAGTGAFGIEALSRGADFALFVDLDARACRLIRANLEALGLSSRSRILRRDAARPARKPMDCAAFDLAFADPPYGRGLAERGASAFACGGWLAADSLLAVEEAKASSPACIEGFERVDSRRAGGSEFSFWRLRSRRSGNPPPPESEGLSRAARERKSSGGASRRRSGGTLPGGATLRAFGGAEILRSPEANGAGDSLAAAARRRSRGDSAGSRQ